PKPLGYKLEQVEKVGDDMIASVNVVESKSEKSYCSILNMSYTMSKINNKNMLIKRIDNNGQLAFFLDIKQNVKVFVTKEDNAAKGTVVFDVSEIPSYMVVKSAQEPLRKVELSREDFGPVAISNDGKHMMITSRKNGNDVLIMIEKVSQVFNIAGGPTGSGGPQGGDGSKQESQVRNIEMQAIDYFEGSTVENIAISPSGDFIVAMVKSGNNTKLSIYSTYNKEILLLKVMEKFKVDEYTILNSYFNDKDTIVLTVKNLKKNINENYSISIKTDEISKLD
ncbi:MAG: hypothetical protein RR645_04320, partial [Clostridium sp.]